VETIPQEPQSLAPPVTPGPPPLNADQQAALKALGALGATIAPITADSPDLDAHFELLGDRFTDQQAAEMYPLRGRLVWLNLAGTGITDETVRRIAQMPNLERLHLENTAVTDIGVADLATLQNLRYLNLHTTRITDAAVASIAAMPALERVYLWDTAVTAEAVDRLRAARPELTVEFTPE